MKGRVIIIDDDKDLLEVYEKKFIADGYEVEIAANGAWGLRLLKEKDFDLVVLDMAMPAMNGLEMLREIQEEKEKKGHPKVIALSNTALEEEMLEMRQAGADKCFIKIQVTPAQISEAADLLLNKNDARTQ